MSELVPENANGAFCFNDGVGSLPCKFELFSAILDFDRFEVSKHLIFHNSSPRSQMVRFLSLTLRAAYPANLRSIPRSYLLTGLRSGKILLFTTPPGDRKWCVLCYAQIILTLKFELNTALLEFDRFENRKNPIFINSSRRPQIVRFVLVMLRAAYPANLRSMRRF